MSSNKTILYSAMGFLLLGCARLCPAQSEPFDRDWPMEKQIEYIRNLPRLEEIDGVTEIRGVAFRDLTSRDQEIRFKSMAKLLENFGTTIWEWTPIEPRAEEKRLLFEMVRRTWELEDNPNNTNHPRRRMSRAIYSCNDLCRSLLSRIPDRKILAYVLSNVMLFDRPWKDAITLSFTSWNLGEKADFEEIDGVYVHASEILVALHQSQAFSPELLVEMIASGEASVNLNHPVPIIAETFQAKREHANSIFVVASAQVLHEQLERRKREGAGGAKRAVDFVVNDDAPAADVAKAVLRKAEELRLHYEEKDREKQEQEE